MLAGRAARARRAAAGCTCATSCPTRDETTERDVDPMRLLIVDGRWYLEGWCHRAEAVRLFRLDRVGRSRCSTSTAELPAARPVARDLTRGCSCPRPDDLLVTLELDPPARWVADYYPVESVEELPDGRLLVAAARRRHRVAAHGWCCGSAARRGSWSPPSSPSRCTSAPGQALAAYADRLTRLTYGASTPNV